MSSTCLLYKIEPAPEPVPISKTKLELYSFRVNKQIEATKSAWKKMFESIYWNIEQAFIHCHCKRIMTNQPLGWYGQPDTRA